MVTHREAALSVVIVTYNSSSTIKECLDSLIHFQPDCEIIVVDNNSQDQTLKIIEAFKSKIELIISPTNVGFARAVNQGAALASNDYLVLFNPDCHLIAKDSLKQLQQQLTDHTDYGMVGPMLLHADGSIQKPVRNLPTVIKAVEEYLLQRKDAYEFYIPAGKGLQSVESIVAACVVIPKELFKKIGGMSEKYFMYFEDLELCRQILKQGYKIGYYPLVQIKHTEGVSGQGSEKTRQFAIDSAKKYQGVFSYYLISLIGRIGHKIYG